MTTATTLVQDFIAEAGVFFLGLKGLNVRSVPAARGSKDRVLPVVGRHLFREIAAETCWAGGRIDPSRTRLNYSLLDHGPTTAASMVAAAFDVMNENGINWPKLRRDKIVAVELVVSLPPDFRGDHRAFFERSLEWTKCHFPAPMRVIAAIIHMDEGSPHMHAVVVPVVGPGRMDGHAAVGFKGVHNKRLSSFHKEVARHYGLRKPRSKVQLNYKAKQLLAERIVAMLIADGWACSPEAAAAMRRVLTVNPVPMAQALGLIHDAGDTNETAYAVAEGDALLGTSTALLCNAVAARSTVHGEYAAGGATDAVPPSQYAGGHFLAGDAFHLTLPALNVTAICESGPVPEQAIDADIVPTPIYISPDLTLAAPDPEPLEL